MSFQQLIDGFRVVGPIGSTNGRVTVAGRDLDTLFALGHHDKPCESAGGEHLPCPVAELTCRFLPANPLEAA